MVEILLGNTAGAQVVPVWHPGAPDLEAPRAGREQGPVTPVKAAGEGPLASGIPGPQT